jgi:hypothetical protein
VTAPRFLIDENLSPALVEPARRRGFEAMHVNYLGLRTETDWDLLKVIAEQDWVLVTNTRVIEDLAQHFELLWIVNRQQWRTHMSARLAQHIHARLDLRLRRAKRAAPIWADQPRHQADVATGRVPSGCKVIRQNAS